jgi:large subunit ribosomal protein L4
MELSVLKITGEETGRKVNLDDTIFGIEPNDHAIYLDVKRCLANARQGTHKTKEKWEVDYSTKKLKRQKGTGGARAGSRKSPLLKGGGRVFGPKPHDYDIKLNKKVKQLARFSALSYKAKENSIIVLEPFTFEAPKTKNILSITDKLKVSDKKVLLVINESDKSIYLSSRNLKGINVLTVSELNTYDIMNSSVVLIQENSLNSIQSKN